MAARPRVDADDFFTGLFAALATRGVTTVGRADDRFYRAAEAAFKALMAEAERAGLDVRFRVRLHPIHRDSEIVRDAVARAAKARLVSLDNPVFKDIRLKVEPTVAESQLRTLPGGPDLYKKLAGEFVESYT